MGDPDIFLRNGILRNGIGTWAIDFDGGAGSQTACWDGGYEAAARSIGTIGSSFVSRPIEAVEGPKQTAYAILNLERKLALREFDYCKGCFGLKTIMTKVERAWLMEGTIVRDEYCNRCNMIHDKNSRRIRVIEKLAKEPTRTEPVNDVLATCDSCLRKVKFDFTRNTSSNEDRLAKCLTICYCCGKRNCHDCLKGAKRFESEILEYDDERMVYRRPLFVWHPFQKEHEEFEKKLVPKYEDPCSLCLNCFERVFCYPKDEQPYAILSERGGVETPAAAVRDLDGLVRYILKFNVWRLWEKMLVVKGFSIAWKPDRMAIKMERVNTRIEESSEDTEMYDF
jgi:hypothetical protein